MTDNTSNVGNLPLKFAFFLLLAITLIISPITVSAQTLAEVENECSFAPTRTNFNVQTSLSSQNVTAGRQLLVDVGLRNNSVSTVSDISLLLLVYKKTDQNIPLLTDYTTVGGIDPIQANDELIVSYTYDVPTTFSTGEYLLRVMPIFGNRHSYSERVALSSQSIQGVPFAVSGSQNSSVIFTDVSLTQDNITPFDGVSYILPDVDQVQVNFSLPNNSDNLVTGNFNWYLFDGRVITDTARIASGRAESLAIQPQSTVSQNTQIPLSKSGEYTLLLKYEVDNGTKSYFVSNLLVQGVSDVRILNATPINSSGNMMLCLERYGFGVQDDAVLSLMSTSEDIEGENRSDFTIQLGNTPATFSLNFAKPFTAPSNIRLVSGGSIAEQWYLCESDFVDCPIQEEDSFNPFLLVLTVVLLVGGVTILFIIRRRL